MRFTFSILFFLIFVSAYAQRPTGMRPGDNLKEEDEEDTTQYVKVKKPKEPIWPPRALRIGYDGLNGIISAVDPLRGGNEFTVDLDLARFLLVADLGTYRNGINGPGLPLDSIKTQGMLDSIGNNFGYGIRGTYYRFGIAGNILSRDKEGSTFTISLKRGVADFTDSLVFARGINAGQDNFSVETLKYSNKNMHVTWFELNMGMKTRIWKSFWLGYEAGLKFRIRYQTRNLVPFFIPGYGNSENVTATNSTWGFNYYLIYYIPFKRAKRDYEQIKGLRR